jgi:Protein of unknown function (DUF1761)
MPDVNPGAVLVATIVAFVIGGVYYSVLGEQLATVSDAAASGGRFGPWQFGVELARSLILAAVVAGLAARGQVDTWSGGLLLGLVLWIGFPLVLWIGAMIHEKTPWKLAVIHAGDWFVKLLAVAV